MTFPEYRDAGFGGGRPLNFTNIPVGAQKTRNTVRSDTQFFRVSEGDKLGKT